MKTGKWGIPCVEWEINADLAMVHCEPIMFFKEAGAAPNNTKHKRWIAYCKFQKRFKMKAIAAINFSIDTSRPNLSP